MGRRSVSGIHAFDLSKNDGVIDRDLQSLFGRDDLRGGNRGLVIDREIGIEAQDLTGFVQHHPHDRRGKFLVAHGQPIGRERVDEISAVQIGLRNLEGEVKSASGEEITDDRFGVVIWLAQEVSAVLHHIGSVEEIIFCADRNPLFTV